MSSLLILIYQEKMICFEDFPAYSYKGRPFLSVFFGSKPNCALVNIQNVEKRGKTNKQPIQTCMIKLFSHFLANCTTQEMCGDP